MGREIKRVPVGFNWPLNEVWEGFINPHFKKSSGCHHCDRSGLSPEAKRLSDQWYGYAEFDPTSTGSMPFLPTHPIIQERARRNYPNNGFAQRNEAIRLAAHFNKGWSNHLDQNDVDALLAARRLRVFARNGIEHPTAEQVNEWSIGFNLGHDGLNQWVCVREKAKRLGFEPKCSHCNGEGRLWKSEADRQAYEDWTRIQPPTGEGWQLWENVSEGSPISPVFPTEETFKAYLIGAGYSEHAAGEFIKAGHAVSMMMVDGKIYQNIETFDALPDAT